MILRVESAFVTAENGKFTQPDSLRYSVSRDSPTFRRFTPTFVSANPIVYGCFELVHHGERPFPSDLFGKASRRCEHRQTLEAFKSSCREESAYPQTAYRQIERGHSTVRLTQCFDDELSTVGRQRIERQLNSNSSRFEKNLMPYIQCREGGILRQAFANQFCTRPFNTAMTYVQPLETLVGHQHAMKGQTSVVAEATPREIEFRQRSIGLSTHGRCTTLREPRRLPRMHAAQQSRQNYE